MTIRTTNCHIVNINKNKKNNFSLFLFNIQKVVSKYMNKTKLSQNC